MAASVVLAGNTGVYVTDSEVLFIIYALALKAFTQLRKLFRRDARSIVAYLYDDRVVPVKGVNPDQDIWRLCGNTVQNAIFQERL